MKPIIRKYKRIIIERLANSFIVLAEPNKTHNLSKRFITYDGKTAMSKVAAFMDEYEDN